MQGFRDDAGQIWTPGFLVFLQSPFLDIAQTMAVESVTFSQSRDRGSESVLKLVDPRALVDAVAAVKTRTDATAQSQRQAIGTPRAAYAFAYDALTIEELERAVTATRSPDQERS